MSFEREKFDGALRFLRRIIPELYLALLVVMLAVVSWLVVGCEMKTDLEYHSSPVVTQTRAKIKELEAKIKKYETIAAIIECESGGRHDVYGDGGKAYGIAQFHKPTFKEMAKEAGCTTCKYRSAKDQVALLSWAYDNGKLNHWTCAKGR